MRLRLAGTSWLPRHVAVATLCIYLSFAVTVEGEAMGSNPSGGGVVVDEPPVTSSAPPADGDPRQP